MTADKVFHIALGTSDRALFDADDPPARPSLQPLADVLADRFPQGRVTDHRINLTLYKLDEVLEGDLDQVVQPLINEYQADQLAALAD